MNRVILGIALALVALFAAAGTVAAHEISEVDVRCSRAVIHVEGILFGESLPIVVNLQGPDGYSRDHTVTTDSWSHNFPLGPNGGYVLSWPDSGQFTRPFRVDCAAPTPTPHPSPSVGTTPTPKPTPPATDTVVEVRPLLDWDGLLWGVLVLLALTGIVERVWPESRGGRR